MTGGHAPIVIGGLFTVVVFGAGMLVGMLIGRAIERARWLRR